MAICGGTAAVKSASLNRSIFALAIPAIVANITTPLLSLVDITIVGHLGSAVFVGAIAVGGSLFNMIYWLFGFLRFGTSGLTAQSVGRGDTDGVNLTGLRSLLIAVGIGLLLIVLHRPLGMLALRIMDADAETRRMALTYFNILIYGAPAVLMQYSMTGWFVGRQDTRSPMYVSIVVNVVNIGVSLLLVYCFNLGIVGVALGTLIAQWTGCIMALCIACPHSAPWRVVWQPAAIKRFFSVNVDIFLRTLCLIAVTVWFTRTGAAQGAVMLAVNTLLLQLFILFSYFMDGFAFAAEALCGKYYGAGDKLGLSRCIRRFLSWGAVLAVLFTVIYALGGSAFLQLLTDETDVIAASVEFQWWGVAVPLAGFLAFMWDGIVIGLTRTRLMLLSMAVSTALFFGLNCLLVPMFGNHALWLAFISYLLCRGIILSICCKSYCAIG